jgi:hypothetical protein
MNFSFEIDWNNTSIKRYLVYDLRSSSEAINLISGFEAYADLLVFDEPMIEDHHVLTGKKGYSEKDFLLYKNKAYDLSRDIENIWKHSSYHEQEKKYGEKMRHIPEFFIEYILDLKFFYDI